MPRKKKVLLKPKVGYQGPLNEPAPKISKGEILYDNLSRDAIEDILGGGKELLESLPEHEREYVLKWFSDAVVEGKVDNALYQNLWQVDYITKPVSIEQFIEDEYYFGRTCAEIYPLWKKTLSDIFAPSSTISELLLGGAIGTGKSVEAAIAVGYTIYRISCLKNASSYYGLLEGSKIVMGMYSITMTQAADTIFYKLRAMIDSSGYFKDQYPRKTKLDSILRFGNSESALDVISGSRDVHAIGKDLFSVAIDEAAFMDVAQDVDVREKAGQAHQLYNACVTRMESRFLTASGVLPGLMVMISSKRSVTDFMEQRLATVTEGKFKPGMQGQIAPHTYYVAPAIWSVKPSKTIVGMPDFKVLVGDATHSSRILLDDEVLMEEERQIIDVPGRWRRAFVEDCDGALRDLAGVATVSTTPLIRERESLTEAIRTHFKHPFTEESIVISMKTDLTVEHYFKRDAMFRIEAGVYRTIFNPDVPRFIHGDFAFTRDSLSLVCAHPCGMVRRRTLNVDGTESFFYKPFVMIDFILKVKPPVGSEIDLAKILNFVLYLRQFMSIRKMTTDGYQSRLFLQLLVKQGIEAEELSVDRNDIAYLTMRGAFSERCISMYAYPPFLKEATYLEHDIIRKKVDHPTKFPDGTSGSKDCADGVAATVFSCFDDERCREGLPIIMGDGEIDSVSKVTTVEVGQNGQKLSGDWNALRANVKK